MRVEAEGMQPWSRSVVVDPAAEVELDVSLRPIPPPPPSEGLPGAAIGLWAGGGAALAVGAGLLVAAGTQAADAREYAQRPDRDRATWQAMVDEGQALEIGGWSALGAGVVAGVTGAVLALSAGDEEGASVSIAPRAAGLQLGVDW